jgi:hypothetical protein
MSGLAGEAAAFARLKVVERQEAAQLAGLFLAAGIDLREALEIAGAGREAIIRRVERLLERERLRGQARHWSYDLNRHIAIKQALDRLRAETEGEVQKKSGARRRRMNDCKTTSRPAASLVGGHHETGRTVSR